MIGFYLKKNFCDGWDNFLFLAFFNIMILALLLGTWYVVSSSATIPLLSIALLAVCSCIVLIPLFSVSDACAGIADFKSITIKDVFRNFKKVYKIAIVFGIFVSLLVFAIIVGIPFYFGKHYQSENVIWLICGSILLWFVVITLFALQWFMPLYSQLGGGFRKNLKKSYILLFDNIFFSLFLGIYTLFLLAFSALLVLIAPGVSGIILAHNNALRLRMYKYDWIEENQDLASAKRRIPWDELIAEDQETVGERNLRSFIFPWK